MRFLLFVVSGIVVALALAGAVIAEQRRPARCALPAEAARPLDLANPDDSKRLAGDLAEIEQIAERYREAIQQRPLAANNSSTRKYNPVRPDRAYAYCTTILKEQVARTHHLHLPIE